VEEALVVGWGCVGTAGIKKWKRNPVFVSLVLLLSLKFAAFAQICSVADAFILF
jgi:hypothetical protein